MLASAVNHYNHGEYVQAYDILSSTESPLSPEANYLLGQMYIWGRGVVRNSGKAMEHLTLASNEGLIEATKLLAGRYLFGIDGVNINKALGTKMYEEVAEKGDVDFQLDLVHMFSHGIGTEQSCVKARYWLGRLTAKGYEDIKSKQKVLLESGCKLE